MSKSKRHPDELTDLLAAELERRDDSALVRSERLVNWLAHDLRESQDTSARAADEQAASVFVARVRARLNAERAARTLPVRELSIRGAAIRATVAQSIQAASFARCAPLLELAAAAGSGRALWDEMCDQWVEMPEDAAHTRHVAIRVAGDSMMPVLAPRDVILVKLDAPPSDGDLVVARLNDDGYVVKRFERVGAQRVELSSLNPAYAPIVEDSRRVAVMGTVVARFRVEG